MKPTVLFRWITALALLMSVGFASSANNFLPIQLQKGVTVELPKNWIVHSDNQRITLDSWRQAKMEASGKVDVTNDLSFAASFYDDKNNALGTFSVRYYPTMAVTQSMVGEMSAVEVDNFDTGLRKNVSSGVELAGGRILAWLGTKKQPINGATFLVTDYRSTPPKSGTFRVRLVRFLSAQKSFTIIVSYREDQEYFLKPICDRIISSIRVAS